MAYVVDNSSLKAIVSRDTIARQRAAIYFLRLSFPSVVANNTTFFIIVYYCFCLCFLAAEERAYSPKISCSFVTC